MVIVFLKFNETDDMHDKTVLFFPPVFRVICHAHIIPINFDKMCSLWSFSFCNIPFSPSYYTHLVVLL